MAATRPAYLEELEDALNRPGEGSAEVPCPRGPQEMSLRPLKGSLRPLKVSLRPLKGSSRPLKAACREGRSLGTILWYLRGFKFKEYSAAPKKVPYYFREQAKGTGTQKLTLKQSNPVPVPV